MIPDLFDAVVSLVPNANFCMRGDDIEWVVEPAMKPTDKELDTELLRLQTLYVAKDYQRKRAQAYPSIAEQLDTIFHTGLDGWKEQIQTVKDKYPKEVV